MPANRDAVSDGFLILMNQCGFEMREQPGRIFCQQMARDLSALLADKRTALSDQQIRMVITIGGLILLHVEREQEADEMIGDFLFRQILDRGQGDAK